MRRTINTEAEAAPFIGSGENVAPARDTNHWPTAGELFFESGIVIGGALAAAFLVQLILEACGVPPV